MYLVATVTELFKGLSVCDFGSYRCWLSNDGGSVAAFLVPLAVLSLVSKMAASWLHGAFMSHMTAVCDIAVLQFI